MATPTIGQQLEAVRHAVQRIRETPGGVDEVIMDVGQLVQSLVTSEDVARASSPIRAAALGLVADFEAGVQDLLAGRRLRGALRLNDALNKAKAFSDIAVNIGQRAQLGGLDPKAYAFWKDEKGDMRYAKGEVALRNRWEGPFCSPSAAVCPQPRRFERLARALGVG